jgi:MFS family permease
MLWVFLFFGAALVPICTGIMISCVKTEMQATSSSLSQLIFNLFGYFLSPFLTGFVMDCFENKRNGFIWGMRIVFWWVILAMGCLIWAFMIEYQKKLERENSVNFNIQNLNSFNSEEDELEEGISEFIRLEIRRRMALSGR